MKTLYLIDGYSFVYRAFFAYQDLTSPAGIPIGAVYGFTGMILKLMQAHKPAYGVVAYDNASPTLRKQAYPFYKGNRRPNDDLTPQFSLVRDSSRALGFANIEAPGYEADDIIATLAERAQAAGMNVVIVSCDKDLMQLINDRVTMFDPMQDKFVRRDDVRAKFGVYPEKLRDVLALTGDVSDNIPGVPGVGYKKAAMLVNDCGTLERVLEQAGCITQPALRKALETNVETARTAYKLVGLLNDAPIYLDLEDMKVTFHRETAMDFCRSHGFKSLYAKI